MQNLLDKYAKEINYCGNLELESLINSHRNLRKINAESLAAHVKNLLAMTMLELVYFLQNHEDV